jgi:hypothetical protein
MASIILIHGTKKILFREKTSGKIEKSYHSAVL